MLLGCFRRFIIKILGWVVRIILDAARSRAYRSSEL